MMARRRQDLEWKQLGHAIQHTKMFENVLLKRFPIKPDFSFEKVSNTTTFINPLPGTMECI